MAWLVSVCGWLQLCQAALRQQGAQVIVGDCADPAYLTRAFEGAPRDPYDVLGIPRDASLEEARANRFPIAWKTEDITKPNKLGITELKNFPLGELVPYIDWTPFFQTWDLHGKYPQILSDAIVGDAATKVFGVEQSAVQ